MNQNLPIIDFIVFCLDTKFTIILQLANKYIVTFEKREN